MDKTHLHALFVVAVGFFGLSLVLLLAHNGEVVVLQGSVDIFRRETGQPPKIREDNLYIAVAGVGTAEDHDRIENL